MSDSEIVVSNDPVAQAVAAQIAEMGQWIAYAQTCAESGNTQELSSALVTIDQYRQEIAKHTELTGSVLAGLQTSMDVMKQEIASLNGDIVELEENFEDHAAELAQAMVESELDWIFGQEEEEDAARVRHTARQMIEYSIDEIKESERQATENRLREAESIAMHDLTYNKDLGPDDFDLEDETEEA